MLRAKFCIPTHPFPVALTWGSVIVCNHQVQLLCGCIGNGISRFESKSFSTIFMARKQQSTPGTCWWEACSSSSKQLCYLGWLRVCWWPGNCVIFVDSGWSKPSSWGKFLEGCNEIWLVLSTQLQQEEQIRPIRCCQVWCLFLVCLPCSL